MLRDVAELVNSPHIRVHLDRELILRHNPKVTVKFATASTIATVAYPPWYFDDDGTPVRYDTPGATPQTTSWVSKHPAIESSSRFPTAPLTVPAYRTPTGFLVLDGNHRLVAAATHNPGLPVVALVIQGPLDERILPDLGVWSSMRSRGRTTDEHSVTG